MLYYFNPLTLTRFIWWPSICSLLENVPCTLEDNLYSVADGGSLLYALIRLD